MKRGAQPVYTPVRPKKEMLMDARVYELLNDQINKELYSSYLYLSFADYYEEEGLEGFANWYVENSISPDKAPVTLAIGHTSMRAAATGSAIR